MIFLKNDIFEILQIDLHGFPKKFSVLMKSKARICKNPDVFLFYLVKKNSNTL